jgi:hypothetical protein
MNLLHIIAADPQTVSTQAEIWTRFVLQILATVGSAAVAIYTVFRKTGGIQQRVTKAAEAADRAAELAKPTGNGFAKNVLESQAQILARLDALAEDQAEARRVMTKHLEFHVEKGN